MDPCLAPSFPKRQRILVLPRYRFLSASAHEAVQGSRGFNHTVQGCLPHLPELQVALLQPRRVRLQLARSRDNREPASMQLLQTVTEHRSILFLKNVVTDFHDEVGLRRCARPITRLRMRHAPRAGRNTCIFAKSRPALTLSGIPVSVSLQE